VNTPCTKRPPAEDRAFIREICDAIAHRWQPERIFVVLTLTTYLDESGTHGDSPVTVMAGIMANAHQWDRFETEFGRLKAQYGFRVFHTKKFKRRRGDFEGWHPIRQFALMQDLGALMSPSEAFIDSVTVTLNNADYKADYITGDKPRRLRLESKYGLCFRNCLMYFMLEGMKWIHEGSPPKMHFVLESGHPNRFEAVDIFNELKKEVKGYGADLLGEITLADKDDCNPLMMADFLAHTAYLMGQKDEHPANETAFADRAAQAPLPAGESGVTHLRFAPGGLADLKNVLIEKLAAKNASAKRPASEGQSS